MLANISRSQLLAGDLAGKKAPIRPPWALAETPFQKQCNACGDCVRACPEQILIHGRAGYPQVDFSRGGCLLCGDCVRACRQEAFTSTEAQAWTLSAAIGESCLSFQGVECRSCGDHCETPAIRFQPQIAAAARPELDATLCSGCGACVAVCPAGAIFMQRPTQHQIAGVDAS